MSHDSYIETFSLDVSRCEDFARDIIAASSDSWSPLAFTTVFFGGAAGCKSESAYLTNDEHAFFGPAGETGARIANELREMMSGHLDTYCTNHEVTPLFSSPFYAIRTTKVFESDKWSVPIDGNLMDGLVSIILCIGAEAGAIKFRHFDEEFSLNPGDAVVYPAGFPYSPQLAGGNGTLYVKTTFR